MIGLLAENERILQMALIGYVKGESWKLMLASEVIFERVSVWKSIHKREHDSVRSVWAKRRKE